MNHAQHNPNLGLPPMLQRTSNAPYPQRNHSQGCLAHNSVGLRRPATPDASPMPCKAASASSSSSCDERTATRWFDDVNENVASKQRLLSTLDDDPPYYLQPMRSSVSSTSPALSSHAPAGNFQAFRGRDDSENEDLRGVIDDLTIENRKLKQRLRNHDKLHSPDIQHGKLLEVFVHGLPPNKKRELEGMLKNFIAELESPPPTPDKQSFNQGSSMLPSATINLSVSKRTSSSIGQPADSGYASMSILESACNAATTKPSPFLSSGRAKKDEIKSYLHDIPTSSLPKKSPVLSEWARMKDIVRRLEHLFTGQQAAPGEHSQPVQQQEVSHNAARADRRALTRSNHQPRPEGTREAHIIPIKEAGQFEPQRWSEPDANNTSSAGNTPAAEFDITSGDEESPDQRPTRPMDLDLQRAQVPAENVEYLRHLGFPSPQINSSPDTSDEGHGWIYLNLLISMAQLHTLNVTSDFIKKAISQLSSKFELSNDGSRVRWIGGTEATQLSSDTGSIPSSIRSSPDRGGFKSESSLDIGGQHRLLIRNESGTSFELPCGPCSAVAKHQMPMNSSETTTRSDSIPAAKSNLSSRFDYTPIRFLQQRSRQDSDHLDTESDDPGSATGVDETTERGSGSNEVSGSISKFMPKLAESGSIIFYNNPFFCTDSGGDLQSPIGSRFNASQAVLGLICPVEERCGATRKAEAFNLTSQEKEVPIGNLKSTGNLSGFDLSPLSLAGKENDPPIELEVSGIGGVQPKDNFAFRVRWSRTSQEKDIKKRRFEYNVLSAERTELADSPLPAPSYLWRNMSLSSDDEDESLESDFDDRESRGGSLNEKQSAPPSLLDHFNLTTTGGGEAGSAVDSSVWDRADSRTLKRHFDHDETRHDSSKFARLTSAW